MSYIYKINYNDYECSSYLYLSNTKEYTKEQFNSVFNESLLEARKQEKEEYYEDRDEVSIWVCQYISKAIDIMIEKYQFKIYEPEITRHLKIFTDTDKIDIK